MDFRFTPPTPSRSNVFDRLYKDSAVRSRNFAYFQTSRTKAPATPRGRKIEDELLRKAAEANARMKALREQREKEQMMEMRTAPLINETSKMLAAAKKFDIIVKKKPHSPPKASPAKLPVPKSAPPQPIPITLPPQDSETERIPLAVTESRANLRVPKPLSLTADLRKKFAELLVPVDDEPTMRPEISPPVKVFSEKQTQSDPKISLALFSTPVNRDVVSTLLTERSPTKRLFYMTSYDRNRYWSRVREEKISKQREEKEELALRECTFRPSRAKTSRNNSFAALPRSKSQPRASSYAQRYQLKREWKSRTSSPQNNPLVSP